MKGRAFESYREAIEIGLQNGMPVEAKLIMAGMLWTDSGPRDRLSMAQYEELIALLGVREEVESFEDAMEYALVGSLDVPEHVQPEGVGG